MKTKETEDSKSVSKIQDTTFNSALDQDRQAMYDIRDDEDMYEEHYISLDPYL